MAILDGLFISNTARILRNAAPHLARLSCCTVGSWPGRSFAPARRPRQRALIGGPILIITAISALLGISVVSILFQKELSATFLFLFTSMPRFDVLDATAANPESALYNMYVNFRTVSFFVMSIAIVMAGLSFGLESVNLVPPKMGAKILGNGILYLILIMVFPYFWDMTADVVEWTSLWILNPEDPSASHETVAELLSYMSPGAYPAIDYVLLFGGAEAIIANAAFDTIVGAITGGGDNAIDTIGEGYQRKVTTLLTEVLLYVLKAIALLTMSLTAFLLGTVRYVLTGLLAVAVPLILALSLIPQFNRMTALMRDTLVALMIVPIFSALAVAAGVAVLVDLDSSEFGRIDVLDESDGGSRSVPPALEELTYGVRKFFMALAVLVLAIYFPAMLAPMISNIMSSVQQHISTTGIAGSMIVTGAQAAVSRSVPAVKWGAGRAHTKTTELSEMLRRRSGALRYSQRHAYTGMPNRATSNVGAPSSSASQDADPIGTTQAPREQEGSKSREAKQQTQRDIVSKGNPKIPSVPKSPDAPE